MGFFKKLGGVFGLNKAGGSREAFSEFQKFRGVLTRDLQTQLLGIQQNPFLLKAAQRMGTLGEDVRTQVSALQGALQQQARAGAQGGILAAQLGARQAAGGRGGLAFSAGAGALGGRFAQQAGLQQQQALAQALTTGGQLGLQSTLQVAGLQSQFGLSAAEQENALRRQFLGGITGLAGGALGGGLQGQQAAAGRRAGLFGGFLPSIIPGK